MTRVLGVVDARTRGVWTRRVWARSVSRLGAPDYRGRVQPTRRPYDHPDALTLTERLQAWYVEVYGGPDRAVVAPEQFAPPDGDFLVGYRSGKPVAMGGWRRVGRVPGFEGELAEIKRVFVIPDARGQGWARAVMAALADSASREGIHQIVLETGTEQPAAIALYAALGYQPVSGVGWAHYVGERYPRARHFGKVLPG